MAFSDALHIPLLEENQAAKEASVNSAILRFEGATQKSFSINGAGGNVTLTAVQTVEYGRYKVSGNTATINVTLPQVFTDGLPIERIFLIDNQSAYPINLVGAVAGSVEVASLFASLVYINGTEISLVRLSTDVPNVGTLGSIGDVDLDPAPTDGQVLRWNTATSTWIPYTPVSSFLGLTQTPDTFSGQDGKYVAVQGSGLVFVDAPTGGGGALTLDELTDVDTSTVPATDGQALVWDAVAELWVPGSVAAGGGEVVNVNRVEIARPLKGVRLAREFDFAGDPAFSETPIPWDIESFDTDGFHSLLANTSRIVVPTGSDITHVMLTVGLRASLVDDIPVVNRFTILKNGGEPIATTQFPSALTGNLDPSTTASTGIISVVEGDYFEVTYTADETFSVSASFDTFFSMVVMGEATDEFVGLLATLGDIDLETVPPVDGNALVYDELSDKWVPGEGGGGGGGAATLDELSDVDLTIPPTDGQVLVYDDATDTFKAGDQEGGIPDAPSNGTAYVRKDAAWVPESDGDGDGGGGGGSGTSSVAIGPRRAWRIRRIVSANANFVAIKEVAFNGVQPTGGTVKFSTQFTTSGNNSAAAAFDGAASANAWATTNLSMDGAYIGYQYAAPLEVTSVDLTAGDATQMPTVFAIDFSDNGLTWTEAVQYTTAAWTANEVRTFEVPSNAPGVGVAGVGITAIVSLTQAEYDATDPKIATTLYVVTE